MNTIFQEKIVFESGKSLATVEIKHSLNLNENLTFTTGYNKADILYQVISYRKMKMISIIFSWEFQYIKDHF